MGPPEIVADNLPFLRCPNDNVMVAVERGFLEKISSNKPKTTAAKKKRLDMLPATTRLGFG